MTTIKTAHWIYIHTHDNKSRFVLGEQGDKPLICFGINSSTAHPDRLDNTVRRVQNASHKEGYDGWIMLNVYPVRATDPKDLELTSDNAMHQENVKHIAEVFRQYSTATVWAAWGNLIEFRPYLMDCLKDIYEAAKPFSLKWKSKGTLTGKGHPRHPLYLPSDAKFMAFDMKRYMED